MFVSERMSKDLITARPELKIAEARNLMLEKKIRHLPVVDEKGLLLGMVSDRDVRSAMPSTLLKKPDYEITLGKIMNYPVSDIMTREPIKIFMYYTIQDVLLIMRKHKVGALPVIDDDGYLRGIVSTRDLLSAFVDVMGIDEPGTLLCILAEDKQGQMKKIMISSPKRRYRLAACWSPRPWKKTRRPFSPMC